MEGGGSAVGDARLADCDKVVADPATDRRNRALALSTRGDLRLARGDWEQGRADHEEAARLAGELPWVAVGVGRMRLRLGDPAAAVSILEPVHRAVAEEMEAARSDVLKARGGAAVREASERLRQWAFIQEAASLPLAQSQLALGQPAAALAVLAWDRSMIMIDRGRMELGRAAGLRCIALLRLGRAEEGRSACVEAEQRAIITDGIAFALAAGGHLLRNDLPAAQRASREALRRSGNIPEVAWMQGLVFERAGTSQGASEAFSRARWTDPFIDARWAAIFGPDIRRSAVTRL